ncbi:MAG: hypothetical protein J7L77_10340 [Clostridiales bacterium]|nr:hypothetical protein [Clostridiales bacterium]
MLTIIISIIGSGVCLYAIARVCKCLKTNSKIREQIKEILSNEMPEIDGQYTKKQLLSYLSSLKKIYSQDEIRKQSIMSKTQYYVGLSSICTTILFSLISLVQRIQESTLKNATPILILMTFSIFYLGFILFISARMFNVKEYIRVPSFDSIVNLEGNKFTLYQHNEKLDIEDYVYAIETNQKVITALANQLSTISELFLFMMMHIIIAVFMTFIY